MRFSNLPKKSQSILGFTLIELMIAISVVAVLSTIAFTVYSQGQKFARDSRRKQDLKQIQNALTLYYQDYKDYPAAEALINSSGQNWIAALTSSYIDKMPLDPINRCASGAVNTTSNCYYYAYQTPNLTGGSCPASFTQHYVLMTNLENTNDPLSNKSQHYSRCDGSFVDGSTGSANDALYVVANNTL